MEVFPYDQYAIQPSARVPRELHYFLLRNKIHYNGSMLSDLCVVLGPLLGSGAADRTRETPSRGRRRRAESRAQWVR